VNNNFTAETLNDLFRTLHDNDFSKTIYIANNPGTEDCDPSIAQAKGWTVEKYADGELYLDNKLEVITMTTTAEEVILSLKGTGTATVNWGDGSRIETKEISEGFFAINFRHVSLFSPDFVT